MSLSSNGSSKRAASELTSPSSEVISIYFRFLFARDSSIDVPIKFTTVKTINHADSRYMVGAKPILCMTAKVITPTLPPITSTAKPPRSKYQSLKVFHIYKVLYHTRVRFVKHEVRYSWACMYLR